MWLLDRIQQVPANRQPTRGSVASQLVESYSGHLQVPAYGKRHVSLRVAFTVSGRTVENAAL